MPTVPVRASCDTAKAFGAAVGCGRRAACERRWTTGSARCVGTLLARRVAAGEVISIGGSCDLACDCCVAPVVCACVAVAQTTTPSAASLTKSRAALRPATTETLRPELLCTFSSTELTVALERNDLGARARPIPRAPRTRFQFAHALHLQCATKRWYRAKKIGSMRLQQRDV